MLPNPASPEFNRRSQQASSTPNLRRETQQILSGLRLKHCGNIRLATDTISQISNFAIKNSLSPYHLQALCEFLKNFTASSGEKKQRKISGRFANTLIHLARHHQDYGGFPKMLRHLEVFNQINDDRPVAAKNGIAVADNFLKLAKVVEKNIPDGLQILAEKLTWNLGFSETLAPWIHRIESIKMAINIANEERQLEPEMKTVFMRTFLDCLNILGPNFLNEAKENSQKLAELIITKKESQIELVQGLRDPIFKNAKLSPRFIELCFNPNSSLPTEALLTLCRKATREGDSEAVKIIIFFSTCLKNEDIEKQSRILTSPTPTSFVEVVQRTFLSAFENLTHQDVASLVNFFCPDILTLKTSLRNNALTALSTLATLNEEEIYRLLGFIEKLSLDDPVNNSLLNFSQDASRLFVEVFQDQVEFNLEIALAAVVYGRYKEWQRLYPHSHFPNRIVSRLADLSSESKAELSSYIKEQIERSAVISSAKVKDEIAETLRREDRAAARVDLPKLLFNNISPSELHKLGYTWLLGGMPFPPRSAELQQAREETYDVMQRAFGLTRSFGSHTMEARSINLEISPMFVRFFEEHGEVDLYWNLARHTFPGKGFIGTLRKAELFPQDFTDKFLGNDPFATFKNGVAPWAAAEIDSFDDLKFFVFRGFFAVCNQTKGSNIIAGEEKALIVFNEHFHNQYQGAYLVPAEKLQALHEFMNFASVECASSFLSSAPRLLKFLCPEKDLRIDLLAESALGSSLSHTFPPGSAPYFEWERELAKRHTSDLFGHVHVTHIADVYISETTHPRYPEMLELWKPLQAAHQQVFAAANSLMNSWDIMRLGLSYYHRGQSSTEGFGFDLEYTSDTTEMPKDLGAAQGMEHFRYQNSAFRMLNEVFNWRNQLFSQDAADKAFPVLLACNLWNANPKLAEATMFLDTYSLKGELNGQSFTFEGDSVASARDRQFWINKIILPLLSTPGIDLRFYPRDVIFPK